MAVTTVGAMLTASQGGEGRRESARMARRRYGWPVYGVALVLGVVVAVAAVEIIAAVLGTAPYRTLLWGYPAEVQWHEPSVRLASIVLVGAGAVLSSLALLPLRRRWLALWTDDPRYVGGLSRAEIREELQRTALALPEVHGAVVALDRRGVTATAGWRRWATPAAVAEAVREELQAKLQELAPAYALRVRSLPCRRCVHRGRVCRGVRGHRVLVGMHTVGYRLRRRGG
jgi:hypothetical protein